MAKTEKVRVYFPSTRYHPTKPARIVQSPADEAELGPGWRDTPYPEPDPDAEPKPKKGAKHAEAKAVSALQAQIADLEQRLALASAKHADEPAKPKGRRAKK